MALTAEQQAELDALENDPELQQYDALQNQQTPAIVPPENVDTSITEALTRGAAQGATFGFADELTAGAENLAGYLPFVPEKSYDQALAESRAEYNLAEEQHPIATVIGDVAGGLGQAAALSMAAPGAGTAASAGGIVSKLRNAAGLVKGAIMPAKEATALKNIAKAAKAGAVIGGVTGIGRSEEEGIYSLNQVVPGAISGALIGGALSGIGQGIGKAGEAISKKIDAGESPYSFQMIRDAWRSGKEGQGYATMKNRKEIEQGLVDAAEDVVRPALTGSLQDLNTLRNYIVESIPESISVRDILGEFKKKKGVYKSGLLHNLQIIGDDSADELVRKIEKMYSTRVDNLVKNNLPYTLKDANRLASEMKDMLQPEMPASVKMAVNEAADEIKNRIRGRISTEKALQALDGNPEMLELYNKYIQQLDPDEFIGAISKSGIDSHKAAKNLAKDVVSKLKYGRVLEPVQIEQVRNKNVLSSPIKVLDTAMHNILNASEKLKNVANGRTDAEKLDDVMRIFKNLVAQTRDNTSGMEAKARYDSAMESIRKVAPAVADHIETNVGPALKKLEIKKYLEGASLGEGIKETGVIKEIIKNAGQLTAGVANIAGQVKGSAQRGVSGPIPGASSILRPTTSFISSIKNRSDEALSKNPNSITHNFISENLDKALKENDEGRRAAIMNTLMQYEAFRKLINTEKEKQE
jgi:hypothetical protein